MNFFVQTVSLIFECTTYMANILTRYAELDKFVIVQKNKHFCQSCANFDSSYQKGHFITVSIF